MPLQELYEGLKEISLKRHEQEDSWFTENLPTKEFSIEREGKLVHYGVWEFGDEDFMVMFKMPNGKYSFRHKLTFDKKIVEELAQLLKERNSD